MPPKAKAKAAGKQNALQAEGWCCSGGSGSNVGGPVFGTVCCSLDWLRSFYSGETTCVLWQILQVGVIWAPAPFLCLGLGDLQVVFSFLFVFFGLVHCDLPALLDLLGPCTFVFRVYLVLLCCFSLSALPFCVLFLQAFTEVRVADDECVYGVFNN